jgi:uncharacterized damage-inducible protein DinB
VYDYLVAARARVCDRVRGLSHRQYTQEFLFAHSSIRSTLVHAASVESWYARILRGRPEPNTDPFDRYRRAGFGPLDQAWRKQAAETRAALEAVRDWGMPVQSWWRTKRWRRGVRTTARDVALQLILHDVHHRAQVLVMLRHLGAPIQGLDYSLANWNWFKVSRRTGKTWEWVGPSEQTGRIWREGASRDQPAGV